MLRTRLLAATAIALIVAGSVQSASDAASSPPSPTKSGTVRAAKPATGHHLSGKGAVATPMGRIKGYTVVTSTALTDPANSQVSGTVACPSGLKVVGGGAVISGSSQSENINGSVPVSSSTWLVYINNSSSTDGTFTVYAECAKVGKYTIVAGASTANASGTQVTATVSCPGSKVPLGGGGVGSSTSTLQNLNSSFPNQNGWRVDVNNASAGSASAMAYAVCGLAPTGYGVVTGSPVTIDANSQGGPAGVACPSGSKVLSGGALSSSGSTSVNLNSTYPSGNSGWLSYENNSTGSTTSLTSYAVCSK